MENVSIIVTHWAMSEGRSEIMRRSMLSLVETAPIAEIIVVDNGGSMSDSDFLLNLTEQGHIACYVRNRRNMHFGYARNQGTRLSSGSYLVIADNDIEYEAGWLEECKSFLETNQGKFLATPLACDPMNRRLIRWVGEQGGWRLNQRAGSNCFMVRRDDFRVIGDFLSHRIAGSKWVDAYIRLGYAMAVMPKPKALDMGFRNGYNLNASVENTKL